MRFISRGDMNRTRSQQPVARIRRSSKMSGFIESDNIVTLRGRGRLNRGRARLDGQVRGRERRRRNSQNNSNLNVNEFNGFVTEDSILMCFISCRYGNQEIVRTTLKRMI
ncbi:unnamed protein product [Brachionus calyciflorus]|uniref:Uncharacterized protein n=1 Tax=Brachionus calyciflorus TaxID=104777 RepID=A0A813S0F1_9BILA|nr:unnamed protein product [Brachionus calyciflorus]